MAIIAGSSFSNVPESQGEGTAASDPGQEVLRAIRQFRDYAYLFEESGTGGVRVACQVMPSGPGISPRGVLPPLQPEWLGDRSFQEAHGTRFAYVAGAMANGIATTRLVVAMARAGCLGFFGAGGLEVTRVEENLAFLNRELGDRLPWGCNLIHSPGEPGLEMAVVEACLRYGVRRIEASAFMAMQPSVVRFAASGLTRDVAGRIQRANQVFAKLSRPEVARPFLEPAPEPILRDLVQRSLLTPEEAGLARLVPVAEDITVEADSGGHTDNRPLAALFPVIQGLRDAIAAERGYDRRIRVGAAGGIGTPAAVAAAFALGASYVLTGSINQACVESGLHPSGRDMLAEAGIADVIMAPAADMFEMGVNLQVLRRATLFGVRAKRLYELYRTYEAWERIPVEDRTKVEQQILQAPFETAWASARSFWQDRDPAQAVRAETDSRHKLALVFRAYLGLASRWAITGDPARRSDYQIWCGPAMGAFNQWAMGSFLAQPEARTVAQVAWNLLEGGAALTRAHQLRTCGVLVPAAAFAFRPRPMPEAGGLP